MGIFMFGRLYLLAMTTLVCLILGFPLAYFIARAPQHWQPSVVHTRADSLLDQFFSQNLCVVLHPQS